MALEAGKARKFENTLAALKTRSDNMMRVTLCYPIRFLLGCLIWAPFNTDFVITINGHINTEIIVYVVRW